MANQTGKTKTVSWLLEKLEGAIASGDHEQAAIHAKELAISKVKCSVKRHRPTNNGWLNVNMYIEDRLAHQGPIPLQLPLTMTITQLKDKISEIFKIPPNIQRWTINDKIADDNEATLDDLCVIDGSAVFLYLVAPNLQMFSRAKRPRIEPEPQNFNQLNDKNNNEAIEDENNDEEPPENPIQKPKCPNDTVNDELITIEYIPLVDCPDVPAEMSNHEEEIRKEIIVEEPPEVVRDSTDDENEPEIVSDAAGISEIEEINDCVLVDPLELKEKKKREQYHVLMMLANCETVPNTEHFNCPICFTDFEPYEGIQLYECLHAFCKDCLVKTIKHCEDAQVQCPYVDEVYSCKSLILEREIRALVDPDIYEMYLSRSMKQAESCAGESAFHCQTPDCTGWCFRDAERYHFSCPKCDKTNCLICKVIHEGKSCMEYQEEILIANNPEHATNLTKEAVENLIEKGKAMKCPTCSIVITKVTGCDSMQCTMCKTHICWATRGPRWGPGGLGDISGGCKCNVGGKKCHPTCQNCH